MVTTPAAIKHRERKMRERSVVKRVQRRRGDWGERKKKKERRRSAQTVRERIRASLCEKQKAEK